MPSTCRQLVLVGLVVLSSSAWARHSCGQFLAAVAAQSDRLADLVRKVPLLERRYENDPFFVKAVEALKDAKDGETRVVQSEDFTMTFTVHEKDGVLTIELGHFGERGLRWGDRPPPGESRFPLALAAMLAGLRARVEASPHLRQVDVIADLVRNPSLPPLLKSLGFRELWSTHTTVRTVSAVLFAGMGVLVAPLLFGKSLPVLDMAGLSAAWLAPVGLNLLPTERRLRLRIELPPR